MVIEQRREQIFSLLNEKKYVTIEELAATLHFSESTIRRDLKKLEQQRLVTCTRGGVVSNIHPNAETPLPLRLTENHYHKSRIAKLAADMVKDNQIIMLDASTTAMEMIPFLKKKKDLTIITCCLSTAMRISEQLNCTLICTGGRFHAPCSSLVGATAESMLKNWFADMMFFSVNSIDAQNGLTDQGEEVAHMKSAMLRQAKETVLLVDSSKFGKTSIFRLEDVKIDHIITNYDPVMDEDQWKAYREKMIFTDDNK